MPAVGSLPSPGVELPSAPWKNEPRCRMDRSPRGDRADRIPGDFTSRAADRPVLCTQVQPQRLQVGHRAERHAADAVPKASGFPDRPNAAPSRMLKLSVLPTGRPLGPAVLNPGSVMKYGSSGSSWKS